MVQRKQKEAGKEDSRSPFQMNTYSMTIAPIGMGWGETKGESCGSGTANVTSLPDGRKEDLK